MENSNSSSVDHRFTSASRYSSELISPSFSQLEIDLVTRVFWSEWFFRRKDV
ncbi:hypothetical protein ISN44_As08g005080 [Arabidopsis suecica]|uniref:Uncharacterized protein n=1 Tax=Arabidopsis suecica TaxID=45249 RepID=A0A8T2B2C5_ARASU|nr:hypothetical protein ISN44_As08g005080 [Arabidopsis suecica]